MITKICYKCKKEKILDEFHTDKNKKDTVSNRCKDCAKKHLRDYYQCHTTQRKLYANNYYLNHQEQAKQSVKTYQTNNLEKIKQRRIIHYQSNITSYILKLSKANAKNKNATHTISEKDIQKKLNECQNKKGKYICPVLGIEMKIGIGRGKQLDNSLSIDCMNPKDGYTPDNIAIMSWRANHVKNDGTAEEHEKIAIFMKKQGIC